MLVKELQSRNLPDLLTFLNGDKVLDKEDWALRRKEIQNLLTQEEYGEFYEPPFNLAYKTLDTDDNYCAGKVTLSKILLTVELRGGTYSFPIYSAIPKSKNPCPAFLHINFFEPIPNKYMPVEEICDNGFSLFSFCYKDVTSDEDDFSDGLAGIMYQGSKRTPTSPGKISIWAWAAMRVMDYLQTLDSIDKKNVAVVGHSRLGKTALVTGAVDDRFAFTISNNSGCSGAAISRDKQGEDIRVIATIRPYWFCPNYQKYIDREHSMPLDQHFLLAAIAPRNVYVASALEDIWADPNSEYLSCVAASPAYVLLGEIGFVYPDRYPEVGEKMHDGSIGYHLRAGTHYFSRYDWQMFIDYINKHKNI
ncbi:MAG: acetylxylan esterase [Firmicutes bacterium]|nr:acetylxylan esterase [Bacillota bacterium]MDD4693835.1 acetylxylan esterase [Bacillota bacterium]